MITSNCEVFRSKKSRFSNEKEVSKKLSNLTRIKITILSDLPTANTF